MNINKKKYKLFIVDDDQMALGIAKSLFSTNYDVETFESNVSLKVKLNSLQKMDMPDLILLDVFLPNEDGFEMASYLINDKRYHEIPFIFQSGSYDPELQQKGFECGASDYILKPYNSAVAMKRIEKAIEMAKLKCNLKREVEIQSFMAKKRAEQLEKNTLQIVDALLTTINAKDEYTKGHSKRVALVCVELAKRISYPEEDIDSLRNAGVLHDIGKIGVKDAILDKPKRLTNDEYSLIQSHPIKGYEILSKIDNFQMESDVARHHHEWFDGTGYPDGLKDEEISLEARIVSIADVYDVMRFGRVYQSPKTKEEIAAEFEKMAGTQFDIGLAFIFAGMIREGKLEDLEKEE